MSFTTEATERLNQQAPELGKSILAFKDLTDELTDSSGVQVGIFIVQLGKKYIYIPVLAKAGTIQPLDSMFCAESKKFIPLTQKSVRWIIDTSATLGDVVRIPSSVIKNPNLYDAIVPPKTGKMSYASEGRISGFLESLPNHIKQAMVDTLGRDLDVRNAINGVMDFNDVFMGPLQRKTPEYVAPVESGALDPVVVTKGDDLTESEVQDILSKGYAVRNSPIIGAVAVESGGDNTWSTVSSMLPGTAHTAMQKDGTPVTVVCLPRGKTADKAISTYNRLPDKTSIDNTNSLVLTTTGGVYTDPNIVVMQQEQDFYSAITELNSKAKPISEVSPTLNTGSICLINTGAEYLGPFDVISVTKASGWTTLDVDDLTSIRTIKIHDSNKSLYSQIGTDIYLSPSATFISVGRLPKELENDINAAEYRYNLTETKMLPVQATVLHRDGIFALDGKEVGSRPQIIDHMLSSWGLDIATAESFVDSAIRKSSVMVKMAAVRGGGRPERGSSTVLSEIPEVGRKLEKDETMTGDSRQRARGMANKITQAAEVGDREVMEATIIAQILRNPDMHGTISEYLPEIDAAVDKLGRTLFLMRINTQKLSEKIEAEALNNLLTSTRNSYRILGETSVELSNLVANE